MAEKTAGQWVGTIVGAVVGFYLGDPVDGGMAGAVMMGASVGGAVGAALDPPKGPHLVGPRLSDLSTQTATYGANIPRLYGSIAVSGNVFWIENNALKEVSTTESQGGKGGGGGAESTTYAYYATFAVGLCEGPIVGVRRIWVGSKLFYDAGSSDMQTIMASNANAELFTLHLGDESQLPDDRMQATLGVSDTPAYRGLAYLVFKDLPLKDHGNTLLGAPIKVEVIASGGIVSRAMTATDTGLGTMMDVVWDTRQFIAIQQLANNSNYVTSPDGVNWTPRSNPAANGANVSVEIASKGKVTLAFWAYQTGIWRTEDGRSWKRVNAIAGDSYWGLAANGSKFLMFAREYTAQVYLSSDGKIWKIAEDLPYPTSYLQKCWGANDEYFVLGRPGTSYITVINADTGRNDAYLWPFTLGPVRIAFMPTAGKWLMVNQSHEVGITADFVNWTTYTSAFSINDICVGDCLYALSSGTTQHGTYDGINWFAVATPNDREIRSMAYADGIGVLVGFYGPSYYMVLHSIGGTSADLGSILQAEVLASKLLTVGDIDVSSIAKPVRGYRVSNVGAIRSAIEPLQAAFPFDVLQAGYKIKFKPRGGSSVATVEASELDARAGNEKPGISIVNAREMDSILPRRVTLKYLDVEREYDIGEQYAERLNTDAINISALDMPLVMAAGEAAGNAEMLLYLYWLERYDISFSLPPSYSHLEPGDVITVNANEGTYSLRLTAINYLSDGRLECSAKYNSAAIYTPTAVGEVGQSTGTGLRFPGDTHCVLLDIPALLDAADKPGFPVAMTGYSAGWSGGVLSRSSDGGQTWAAIHGATVPGATMGYAANEIGAARTDVIDKASALIITLVSGSVSSITEAQMLNGANHFAYGDSGRWEIIAAQNCVLQGDGSYVLTDLLRGRFGSEWACGLHQVGDNVVLMDANATAFIGASLNSIGVSNQYVATTAGASKQSTDTQEMTYTGVNLECLAPVYLKGSRHQTNNDWSAEWLRRTRIGGEWRDYVDATLGEASQLFEVDIYDGPAYSVVKRTISSAAPNANYTSADQLTDFGSIQANIYVKVYQVSASVGRGYPLTGVLVAGATGRHFVQTDDIAYFELLPAALQTLNETFGADTGFTKYTEGTAGTTAVAGSKYTITHVGGRNDIITKNTISFSMPQAWVETTVNVSVAGATGYDNGGVGLVKDNNNFIFASMDRLANIARLQVKIAGANVFIGSVTFAFGTSFKLGLSLVANSACMWADTGSGWTYVVGADVVGYYDFRNSGNLTSWKPGFTLASGGGNSTWEFSAFKAGCFGGVGMRDQTLVTNDDATPYLATATAIQFTATAVDPRGVGYCGIYTLDMTSKALTQTAALMVSRGGKIYNDLACHIIKYAGGNRRVLISTWGNGFSSSLQILHGLLTSGDVLTGANVVSLSQLNLPGQSGVSPGCYDPMLAWDAVGSRWLIAYTLVDNTSFTGNPFYPALAYSADLVSFTLIGKDSGNIGYEGTKIVSDDGVLLITAGGPAGVGNRARVYDASLNYTGVLDLVFTGGVDTQPHAAMFSYSGTKYVLSFDNSRYGGSSFTWGHLRLYSAT